MKKNVANDDPFNFLNSNPQDTFKFNPSIHFHHFKLDLVGTFSKPAIGALGKFCLTLNLSDSHFLNNYTILFIADLTTVAATTIKESYRTKYPNYFCQSKDMQSMKAITLLLLK